MKKAGDDPGCPNQPVPEHCYCNAMHCNNVSLCSVRRGTAYARKPRTGRRGKSFCQPFMIAINGFGSLGEGIQSSTGQKNA